MQSWTTGSPLFRLHHLHHLFINILFKTFFVQFLLLACSLLPVGTANVSLGITEPTPEENNCLKTAILQDKSEKYKYPQDSTCTFQDDSSNCYSNLTVTFSSFSCDYLSKWTTALPATGYRLPHRWKRCMMPLHLICDLAKHPLFLETKSNRS